MNKKQSLKIRHKRDKEQMKNRRLILQRDLYKKTLRQIIVRSFTAEETLRQSILFLDKVECFICGNAFSPEELKNGEYLGFSAGHKHLAHKSHFYSEDEKPVVNFDHLIIQAGALIRDLEFKKRTNIDPKLISGDGQFKNSDKN